MLAARRMGLFAWILAGGLLVCLPLESQSLDSIAPTSPGAQEVAALESPPLESKPPLLKRLFTRAHTLSLVMAGDALLHAPVYEDAKRVAMARRASNRGESKSGASGEGARGDVGASSGESNLEGESSRESSLDSSELDSSKEATLYDFAPMFAPIASLIARHDLAFYNQETILGGSALGLSSYPAFNSPQEFGDTMLSLGFNLISLANNHTLDRGEKGVRAMLAYWQAKEGRLPIAIAGSYASKEDREQPRIYEKNGISYALLAYTYGTNGIPIPEGKDYLVNVYTKEMLERDIRAVREKVDLLLVSMHWGVEYDFTPSREQRELAAFLAGLGVDIIIGNHPHVIQPIERIGHTLVIYSHGNLISAQKGTPRRVGMLTSVRIHLLDKRRQIALSRGAGEGDFIPRVSLSDVRAELIYTYYDAKRQHFQIHPLRKINEKLLPNAKQIYKDYSKILTKAWK